MRIERKGVGDRGSDLLAVWVSSAGLSGIGSKRPRFENVDAMSG
jgi:hypothetical protein